MYILQKRQGYVMELPSKEQILPNSLHSKRLSLQHSRKEEIVWSRIRIRNVYISHSLLNSPGYNDKMHQPLFGRLDVLGHLLFLFIYFYVLLEFSDKLEKGAIDSLKLLMVPIP